MRVGVRVCAPIWTPAGQQHLDGPHQVSPTAPEDELQDRRLVSGEDLFKNLQRRPVGSEAERQADGSGEAFDQHALLCGADGTLLRTLGFGFLVSAAGFCQAVAALVWVGGGFWGIWRVAGVWFGALRGADRVLFLLTGAPPVLTP